MKLYLVKDGILFNYFRIFKEDLDKEKNLTMILDLWVLIIMNLSWEEVPNFQENKLI